MNKLETAKILAVLRAYFPNGVESSETVVDAWHMIMKDVSYEEMNQIVVQVVSEWEGYTMPPPGVFMNKLRKANEKDVVELWQEADKLICKGTVLTQYEFEQASPEVQKYFGSINRIRELAKSPPEATEYEKHHFMREVPVMRETERTRKALAEGRQDLIGETGERLSIE